MACIERTPRARGAELYAPLRTADDLERRGSPWEPPRSRHEEREAEQEEPPVGGFVTLHPMLRHSFAGSQNRDFSRSSRYTTCNLP